MRLCKVLKFTDKAEADSFVSVVRTMACGLRPCVNGSLEEFLEEFSPGTYLIWLSEDYFRGSEDTTAIVQRLPDSPEQAGKLTAALADVYARYRELAPKVDACKRLMLDARKTGADTREKSLAICSVEEMDRFLAILKEIDELGFSWF